MSTAPIYYFMDTATGVGRASISPHPVSNSYSIDGKLIWL